MLCTSGFADNVMIAYNRPCKGDAKYIVTQSPWRSMDLHRRVYSN